MRKTVVNILLALVLAFSISAASVTAAQADVPMPAGECPNGFMPMDAMEHDAMEHTHAGIAADLNGDGTICMREATATIHVHVDNVIKKLGR